LSSDALKCLTTGEHKNASLAAKSKDTQKAQRENKSKEKDAWNEGGVGE
jgi:hypothetical protein